jgi:two-component system, OmpR family, phosphate regulon sensor histidine kinase PhoR
LIRRLSLRVAVIGILALTVVGAPTAVGVLDRAVERAEQAERAAVQRTLALVTAPMAPTGTAAGAATPGQLAPPAPLGKLPVHVIVSAADGTVLASSQPPAAAAVPPALLASLATEPVLVRDGWALARGDLGDGRRLTVAQPAPLVESARREAAHDLRLFFAVGVGLVLFLALLVGLLATRTVGAVVAGVRDVVRGNARRLVIPGVRSDAIADLGAWLNVLAEDVERKSAALELEQGKLLAVLEGMTQGVVGLDDGKVELMNGAARRMLGVTAPLVGEQLSDYVDTPQLAAMLASKKPESTEITLPTKIRALARITAKPSGHGSVLVLEDVSAIRHLETVRRDFVANVSHELRTPVAVIRANAETLLGGAKDDPAIAGRLIEGLHRNAERLARLIADLLDLSRLDAGQYRLELTDVSVKAAAEQALTAIGERGHPLRIEVADDLMVRADRKALDQILVNLLENAVRYTPDGTEVSLHAARQQDRVRIEVRDRGLGIPEAQRGRVFERFYRADQGRVREAGGTGLGLSIVKHLVESMNGEVGLLPNSPSGCVFVVQLAGAGAAGAAAGPGLREARPRLPAPERAEPGAPR